MTKTIPLRKMPELNEHGITYENLQTVNDGGQKETVLE